MRAHAAVDQEFAADRESRFIRRKKHDGSSNFASEAPGGIAFTRMPREMSSAEIVRANERSAAFEAPYTLVFGIPMCAFTDALITIDAGFAKIGSDA